MVKKVTVWYVSHEFIVAVIWFIGTIVSVNPTATIFLKLQYLYMYLYIHIIWLYWCKQNWNSYTFQRWHQMLLRIWRSMAVLKFHLARLQYYEAMNLKFSSVRGIQLLTCWHQGKILHISCITGIVCGEFHHIWSYQLSRDGNVTLGQFCYSRRQSCDKLWLQTERQTFLNFAFEWVALLCNTGPLVYLMSVTFHCLSVHLSC